MRHLFKSYLTVTASLFIVSRLASGLIFESGVKSFFLTTVCLMLAFLIAKPIINILLLPINLLTFGLFRWASSIIVFYLVTLIVPGFRIAGFYFAGFPNQWLSLPAINLSGLAAFVAFSFLFSVVSSLFHWLLK